MTRTLTLITTLVLTPVAHAGHSYAETPEDKVADVAVLAADRAPQWEVGVGFEIGTFHTGEIYDVAYGFDVAGGLRLERLGIYADYMLLGLGAPSTTSTGSRGTTYALGDVTTTPATSGTPSGLAQRLGLDVRYSLGRFAEAASGIALVGDLWVEGGLGEQFIRWNEGGALHRTDLSLGIGMQLGGRGSQHHGAYFLGVRATIASSPPSATSGLATCVGPCDTPTPPLGLDKSVMFTTGVVFGS
jgi:hypothetical protein